MSNTPTENTNNITQHSYSNYTEDEINLIYIISIIIKRKKTAYIAFSLAVLITIIISYSTPDSYKSVVTISVGHVSPIFTPSSSKQNTDYYFNRGYIENPNELYKRLQGAYITKRRKIDGINIIELSVIRKSPKEAQETLEKITNTILTQHESIFQTVINKKKEQLKKLQNNYLEFEKQVKLFEHQIMRLKEKHPEQVTLLAIEKGKILSLLPMLDEQVLNLALSIEKPQARMTGVLKQPSLPAQSNKTVLYMMAGVFVAVMLSILSVFIHEFISNIKREMRVSQ